MAKRNNRFKVVRFNSEFKARSFADRVGGRFVHVQDNEHLSFKYIVKIPRDKVDRYIEERDKRLDPDSYLDWYLNSKNN